MKFFFFIFVVFLFVSCSDIKKGEQLETIEILQKSLDSINTVLIENKFLELEKIGIESKAIETKIKENYSSDTIDVEFAEKLSTFKEMINSIEPLKNAYSKLLKNTKEEKSDLLKLKNDIENGNGERSKYQEYVNFESNKTQQLRTLLIQYVNQRKIRLETYQSLHKIIFDFSFSLITK